MMTLAPIVMKFGGTSVGDASAFNRVVDIVSAYRTIHPVVVVSAMSRVTDDLVSIVAMATDGDAAAAVSALDNPLGRYLSVIQSLLTKESSALELAIESARLEIAELLRAAGAIPQTRALWQDAVIAYGEQLSAILLAAVLRESGMPARYVDARRCIVTDDVHGCATPLMPESERRMLQEIVPLLKASEIPVLGGFIGSSQEGVTTTLGRNGSDYTASIVGAALSASEIQIWTDVSGILTADPRLIAGARTISRLTYLEAAELSYFGAKVLYHKALQPAATRLIPMTIRNSLAPEDTGTLISCGIEEQPLPVKAIVHKSPVTIVRIASSQNLRPHQFLHAIFEVFDRYQTIIDVMTTSEMSVSLVLDELTNLPFLVEDLGHLGAIEIENQLGIITVISAGLRCRAAVVARVFSALSDIDIFIISQSVSSTSLKLVIAERQIDDAMLHLHEAFFEQPVADNAAIGSFETLGAGWRPEPRSDY
jgi:aspartate kinase